MWLMCARRVLISYFLSPQLFRDYDTRICSKIAILNKTFISSLCLIIFGLYFFSSTISKKTISFSRILCIIHRIACGFIFFSVSFSLLNMTFDISNWPLHTTSPSHTNVCFRRTSLLFISHLLLLLLLLVAILFVCLLVFLVFVCVCVCAFFSMAHAPTVCRFCSHQTITQCDRGFPERFCDIIITHHHREPTQRNGIHFTAAPC